MTQLCNHGTLLGTGVGGLSGLGRRALLMLLQLAHFNLFLASIYDSQHCETWLLISTCVLGEWGKKGRQAEQEEQDSNAILGWQEQSENMKVEGGMCNEIKMPPVGFQLSKSQTQMCGRMVLSLFYHQ